MPVPSAQEIRKPLLEAFRGEAPHNYVINELLELIAENLGVRLEEMSSTEKTAFKNNINDAKNFLRKYKLLSHPSKTTYMITRAGSEVLEDNPEVIDDDYFTTPKKIEEKEEQINEIVPKPAATPEPEAVPEIVEESLPVPETEPEPEIVEEQIEEQIEETPVQEPEPELEEAEVEVEELESEAQESDLEIPVDFAEQEFDDAPEEIINEEQEAEFEEVEDSEEENKSEEVESEENFVPDDDPVDEEIYEEPETLPEVIEEDKKMTQESEPEPEEIEQEIEEAPEEVTTMNEFENENETEINNGETSNEIQNIEDAIAKYNDKLAEEVIERLTRIHQDNFSMMVMDLLSKMGYRVFQSARYTNEAEGSDLIHGVILENKPGMNPIYIQVRKLSPSRTIGKADMQDFIDALADKGGKGMFVTTGTFSEQAEVAANDERIMLVDGKKLAGLMIANNFCVSVEKMFELKAIDTEGFSDYEN